MKERFHIADLYRVVRGKNSAIRMLIHLVAVLGLLGSWAFVAPINQTVSFRTRLAPEGELNDAVGAFQPSCSEGGIVTQLYAEEFMTVKEGETLLEFDSKALRLKRVGELQKIENLNEEIEALVLQRKLAADTFDAKKSELTAQLDVEVQEADRLVEERRIRVCLAKSELVRLKSELARGKRLSNHNAISKSEFELLQSEREKAKEDLALAELPVPRSRTAEIKAQLKSLKASHNELVHKMETEAKCLQGKILNLRNEVDQLDQKIEQCSVVAPRDGLVSQCHVRVGDWIAPGKIEITVCDEGYVAEAFLPSRLIGEVRKGNSATIVLDGFDWLVHGSIKAEVRKISADLQQNETVLGDGSTEVVDGYRVWFDLDPDSDFKRWNNVRLGMTGTVEIKTGEEKLAFYLLKRAVGESWIFGK